MRWICLGSPKFTLTTTEQLDMQSMLICILANMIDLKFLLVTDWRHQKENKL